jgi:hypothetical protein
MKGWFIRILVTLSKLQRKAAQAVPMSAPRGIEMMQSRMASKTGGKLVALCERDGFTKNVLSWCLGLPKTQSKQRSSG